MVISVLQKDGIYRLISILILQIKTSAILISHLIATYIVGLYPFTILQLGGTKVFF
jgi:hypothetical protein